MHRSILQDTEECFVTGTTYKLDRHHVMHGAFRKKSDSLGLWVYLAHPVHMALHDHRDPYADLDIELKRYAQTRYEELHSHEEWMQLFGRSYLL